jgi:hypothetical protein
VWIVFGHQDDPAGSRHFHTRTLRKPRAIG